MSDISSMLQSQFLTMTALKNDSTMWSMLIAFTVAIAMKPMMKFVEKISSSIELLITRSIERATTKAVSTVTAAANVTKEKQITASIFMERFYEVNNQSSQNTNTHNVLPNILATAGSETADAIIELMAATDSAKDVRLIHRYVVYHKNALVLSEKDDVHARTVSISQDSSTLKSIEIQIWSYSMTLSKLKDWVTARQETYIMNRANKLGKTQYIFDTIPEPLPMKNQNTIDWDRASKEFSFSLTPLTTTKSMKCMFGKSAREARDRALFYLKNPEWYEKHSVPYNLGFLLTGPPGTGKTSFIKALAKESGRHIFNVTLRGITRSQLTHLFQSPNVGIKNRTTGQTERVIIPVHQRIYLFEDVDEMSNIVLCRQPESELKSGAESSEQPDLAFLLNLLDGVAESYGRILFFTTNHPEKLDPALIRPGRVDVRLELGFCDSETLNEMIRHFLDMNFEEVEFESGVLTPAQAQEIIFRCVSHPENVESELRDEIKRINSLRQEEILQALRPSVLNLDAARDMLPPTAIVVPQETMSPRSYKNACDAPGEYCETSPFETCDYRAI